MRMMKKGIPVSLWSPRGLMSGWSLLNRTKIAGGRGRRRRRKAGSSGSGGGPVRKAETSAAITGRENPMFGHGPTPKPDLPRTITLILAATVTIWYSAVFTGICVRLPLFLGFFNFLSVSCLFAEKPQENLL